MNTNQMQQEILTIKEMIEKTRNTTAESGNLFIYIGIISALTTVIIGILEIYKLNQFVIPAVIILTVVNAFIGYIIAAKEDKNEKVKTYLKTIFWHILMACGFAAVLIVFLFPFLELYPFHAVPVLISLVMGIALFITGTIFESKYIQWSSSVWWIGACILALTEGQYRFMIMVAIIFIGWIIPGYFLNKQYKKRNTI